MLLPFLLAVALASPIAVPGVPGMCTAPMPADPDAAGCYKTNEISLVDAPARVYWHILQFDSPDAANAEARRHRWSAVARAHDRTWLYVLGAEHESIAGGDKRAVIGPLAVPNKATKAYFAESVFPPGMRTRVHSHPGPEAFYVVDGTQCLETPHDKRMVGAGGTYVVAGGLHIQGAPRGRRNLVLILAPAGARPVIPGGNWTPSDFCD